MSTVQYSVNSASKCSKYLPVVQKNEMKSATQDHIEEVNILHINRKGKIKRFNHGIESKVEDYIKSSICLENEEINFCRSTLDNNKIRDNAFIDQDNELQRFNQVSSFGKFHEKKLGHRKSAQQKSVTGIQRERKRKYNDGIKSNQIDKQNESSKDSCTIRRKKSNSFADKVNGFKSDRQASSFSKFDEENINHRNKLPQKSHSALNTKANLPVPMIEYHTYEDFAKFKQTIGDKEALSFCEQKKKRGISVLFPEKLHKLLSSDVYRKDKSIASWAPHGRCFALYDPKKFVDLATPMIFKHSTLASFQRQLNLYGFRRITNPKSKDDGSYYHELFLEGRPDLCLLMRRQTIKGARTKDIHVLSCEPDFYNMEPCIKHNVNHDINLLKLNHAQNLYKICTIPSYDQFSFPRIPNDKVQAMNLKSLNQVGHLLHFTSRKGINNNLELAVAADRTTQLKKEFDNNVQKRPFVRTSDQVWNLQTHLKDTFRHTWNDCTANVGNDLYQALQMPLNPLLLRNLGFTPENTMANVSLGKMASGSSIRGSDISTLSSLNSNYYHYFNTRYF